jgi:hypothetical protein
MRINCGELNPGAVIRPVLGEWRPHIPERLDEEELADWRAGRNAIYQLAALTSAHALRSRMHKAAVWRRGGCPPLALIAAQ